MDLADIARVQRGWAEGATRGRDCGFDIVYVYGAHAYLPMQFLSPFYNKRTDGYGGPLKDRARFWLETLAAVRNAVGADCAIATRISVDALGPAGIHVEEALGFVNLADDLVDLWDVNVGSIAYWSKDSGTSRYFPEGYQLEWTGGIREATAKPIVGVGRDASRHLARRGVTHLRPDARGPDAPSAPPRARRDHASGRDGALGRAGAGLRRRRVRGAMVSRGRRVRGRHTARVRRRLYRDPVGDPAALGTSGIEAVYRIGDCVAPRMISEAIFDGHSLAREIDGDDPSIALPFDRERNVPDVEPIAR